MRPTPFYDPSKTYQENYKSGPYGTFTDGKIYNQNGAPKHDYLGQSVFLPFGIPAGPLLNSTFVNAALDHGFDVCVYKTVRTKKHPSHAWPNILSLSIDSDLTEDVAENGILGHHDFKHPHSITNSFGVPSFEPDIWQNDLAHSVKQEKNGQIVVGSFQGTTNSEGNTKKYFEDFILAAKLMKETKVKAMEVNLSCPNEGHLNFLCFDINATKKIAEGIKNQIGNTPLTLKISYFHDNNHLRQFVKELGNIIDGIAAINTLSAKIIDEHGMQILPGGGRITSGVCGKAIKWAGLSMVKRLHKHRSDFDMKFKIEAVGGVITPEDYLEYKGAGADSVMSATGSIWNPNLAIEIKDSLNKSN